MTIGLTKQEVLDFEVEAFTELIQMINVYGLEPKKAAAAKPKPAGKPKTAVKPKTTKPVAADRADSSSSKRKTVLPRKPKSG
jgi:hypothetical protein